MKNWQFFIAIIILLVLTTMKIKERFDPITYDIANTINYNDSGFNKMSEDLFKKNKQMIREEDEYINKNIKINEDIPTCNVSVTTNRARYKDEVVPMNKKCKEDSQIRGIEMNKCFGNLSDKNKELDLYNSQIPEIDRIIAETDRNEKNAKRAFENRVNLPSGWYSIQSLRNNNFCTAHGHTMFCDTNGVHGPWQKYYITNYGHSNLFSIKGINGFCSDDGPFICNRGAVGGWEYTRIFYLGRGEYAFRGGKFGKLCSNRDWGVTCDTWGLGQWEKFRIQPI